MIYQVHTTPASPPHYLMGTMHSRDRRAFVCFDRAVSLMSECTTFAPEMDTSRVEALKLRDAFSLPQELNLRQVWDERRYAKNKKILLKAFSIDLDPLTGVSPIYIQGIMMAACLGSEHATTLDQSLLDLAISRNMQVVGVESADEQYQIAQSLDTNLQIRQFSALLRRPEKFRHQAHKLADLYAAGEAEGLYRLGKRSLGAFRHTLLYERNVKMAATLSQLFAGPSTFAAIGAAHLPGEKGVLRWLKMRGYKIVRCD